MRQRKDITGHRFGKLLVIGHVDNTDKNKSYFWKCKCDCGNEKNIRLNHLKMGRVVSCGCYRKQRVTESLFKDVSGKRFGRLLAISPYKNGKHYWWKCKCDCGNTTEVTSNRLLNRTQSCGCLTREKASETMKRVTKTQKGKNHPRWNPNITDEERDIKYKNKGKENLMKVWRNSVYLRDKYTCQKCLDDCGGNLNAHHIYSRDTRPDKKYEIDNGITLCKECHTHFHQENGYGQNTPEQLNEFMPCFKEKK